MKWAIVLFLSYKFLKYGYTESKVSRVLILEILTIRIIRDKYCGVMKPLADMPSCLGGGVHRTNKV